jgi:hypothetical protein
MSLISFLLLFSGIAWSIVYVASIRIGLRDKTYAMPFWALALNIAWECLHAILGLRAAGFSLQIGINFAWFLLDLGLLYTYFRFGKQYFPNQLGKPWFYAWSIVSLVSAFIIQYVFIAEFGLMMAAVYTAFLQNLLMSILFIVMLAQRNSAKGQSMLIAISKCLGTLAPTILMGVLGIPNALTPNILVLVIGSLTFIVDLAYILLLSATVKKERIASVRS